MFSQDACSHWSLIGPKSTKDLELEFQTFLSVNPWNSSQSKFLLKRIPNKDPVKDNKTSFTNLPIKFLIPDVFYCWFGS